MAEATQALAPRGGGNPSRGGRHDGRIGEILAEYLGDGAFRQLGLIIGLAAAIAAGISLYMWAQEPAQRTLFSNLPSEDTAAVIDALKAASIPYEMDDATGAIQVPAESLHDARLTLAGEGLPNTGGVGFEGLRDDPGFGTSRFMETARFQRSLETELGRTIGSLRAVRSARVHLAIPERSAFLRDRKEPRASVTVGLFPGRALNDGQVAAIANMVASAVPELAAEQATVVDQRGRLLTADDGNGAASGSQLEYQQRLERLYVESIRKLLAPIVGADRVRAQVNARIDFSRVEETAELYDPDSAVIRSEQLSERETDRRNQAMGIPGALSNQPPGGGELADTEMIDGEAVPVPEPEITDRDISETRNYEISRTVRHTQGGHGGIERLSVAVLLDEPAGAPGDADGESQAFTEEELERISSLVRQAVGFDEGRGDSLNVVSVPFQTQPAEPQPVAPPVWEQQWFLESGKLLLAGLLGLVLILAVVRPLVNALLGRDRRGRDARPRVASTTAGEPGALENEDGPPQLAGPSVNDNRASVGRDGSYADKLRTAREVVSTEPALAANVVKSWLAQPHE